MDTDSSTQEQLELFHDDLTFLCTKYMTFDIDGDRLHCEALEYNPESNTIEFYVINGDWFGTLFLDNKTIFIHYTKATIKYETISNIKPPGPFPEVDELRYDDITF